MASRIVKPILVFSLLLAAAVYNGVAAVVSSSSEDSIPDLTDTRRRRSLRYLESSSSSSSSSDGRIKSPTTLVDIPQNCLNLLAASANNNDIIKKEGYYVFTNGMSNEYYSFNDMTSYSQLPYQNKFGFVTLSCMCKQNGGARNCCQGNRAHLDVSGIDVANPHLMEEKMQYYIADICKTTLDAIGDDKILPETGEMETREETDSPTSEPTESPTAKETSVPTESPTVLARTVISSQNVVIFGQGDSDGSDSDVSNTGVSDSITDENDVKDINGEEGNLTVGAWAGIAIAGSISALFLVAIIYLVSYCCSKNDKEEDWMTNDRKAPPFTTGMLILQEYDQEEVIREANDDVKSQAGTIDVDYIDDDDSVMDTYELDWSCTSMCVIV